MTIYQKALEKENVYLAPEQFQKLENGELEDEHDSQSEVFSIGMTLINSGILNDDYLIFDMKNNKFNPQEYDNQIQNWILSKGYSEILKATILNLVSLNPMQRLTS